ncbi:lysophospholipid acyltransferase family protein [Anaerosalibacter sp. Marseille-P3206]|uniref:lysophospholipid acyltransferase family protein n=1 Tax=Anaerosalibacter sp. Marseille-P3206 TaxID=1871005 RepID=UPI000984ABD4|nr:lysophospholipid acyltransferase family protein [Anaerosalibacter sp. Marseille-P3206]
MLFYKICYCIGNAIFRIVFRFNVNGKENIPKEGRIIVCSNHISNFDPLILGLSMPRQIRFMAKKELFKNTFLDKFLSSLGAFPIDRQGADLSAIRTSINILKNEEVLGIFPEGTRVFKEDINKAKPGIGMIAIKGRSPVVPVFINSKYKLFSKVNITIGKPLYFNDYYDKKLNKEDYTIISQNILKAIYSLK